MPCTPFVLPDGSAAGIICTRGPRRAAEPCQVPGCTRPHVALCDWKVSREGRRCGDRWRWAFTLGNALRCPRCARATEHHRAPREVVEAEECLCGACRTRRKFEEDAADGAARRRAA